MKITIAGNAPQEFKDKLLARMTRDVLRPATSWKAEVLADSSGHYASNALRFATQAEAGSYAIDLFHRWSAVKSWRTVPSSDPVTYAWIADRLVPVKRETSSDRP
jgi:hypothetical protein